MLNNVVYCFEKCSIKLFLFCFVGCWFTKLWKSSIHCSGFEQICHEILQTSRSNRFDRSARMASVSINQWCDRESSSKIWLMKYFFLMKCILFDNFLQCVCISLNKSVCKYVTDSGLFCVIYEIDKNKLLTCFSMTFPYEILKKWYKIHSILWTN